MGFCPKKFKVTNEKITVGILEPGWSPPKRPGHFLPFHIYTRTMVTEIKNITIPEMRNREIQT